METNDEAGAHWKKGQVVYRWGSPGPIKILQWQRCGCGTGDLRSWIAVILQLLIQKQKFEWIKNTND